jgi:hypothetical protein
MPQADEDVVLEAVRQNRVAMRFAAESLRLEGTNLPSNCDIGMFCVSHPAAAEVCLWKLQKPDTVPGVSQIDSGTW